MFLRSLSLRGFKSFADRTVLDVEPGITVIVGPNGSGKSNVVDALAWVLGTHSARKVRGGSMADVVFAGSPNRNRANQARVEITIDNSDGVLSGGVGTAASAGEFGEVRVARVIHHDGEALYEINGEEVRALDVQELLSDTGLGRELHTVIGQGQLDEILNARPEERRRYIEEAAGILKHRRRRERALRKLEQVDEHVERLRTVLRELRRQLRPLERQAEAADRHAALQSELRDVRVRSAAVELDRVTRALEAESRGTSDVTQRLEAAERAVSDARERRTGLEQEVAQTGTSLEAAGDRVHAFTSLTERVQGTADLVEARRRHLIEYVEEPLAGRPPAQLREDAARVDAQRATLTEELERRRLAFDEHLSRRREAEGARREHEQAVQAERRRRAQQRERVLRWEGEVSALRGAIASAESELGRVTSTVLGLDTRIAETRREADTVENDIQELDVLEVDLTATLEDAESTVEGLDTRHRELTDRVRDLEARRSSQAARAEALRAALAESDAGVAALLDGFDRARGRVADHVRVDPDAANAVAAVLGTLADAVVVPTGDAARDAVSWLRDSGAGRAVVVSTEPEGEPAAPDRVSDPGATPLADHVHTLDGARDAQPVVAAVRRWLVGCHLVRDWRSAVQLHRQFPGSTFVTPAGDVAGPHGYRAGGPAERSAVTTAAAAETAEREVGRLDRELARASAERDELETRLVEARRVLDDATDRINESDARITGAAERLARLHKELHALTNQRQVVAGQQQELEQVLERDRASLSELHGRGPDEDEDVSDDEPAHDSVAEELDAAVEAARERELDARVGLERVTEQVRHLQAQADAMRSEADEVEAALADAARRRDARRRGIDRCGQIAVIVRSTLEVLERSSAEATANRRDLTDRLADARARLAEARAAEDTAVVERDTLRDDRHATDLRRADAQNRLEALERRLRDELSLTPDDVRTEHPDVASLDPDALAEREDVLVRRIGLLGRVNPLALEEFRALEERHSFLSDQLDDLRRSRRDLEQVVEAVDDRIRAVFREAFDDVAREFELTFQTVFPGGHGRLVLTESDDLLSAGVDVEARPPGKRVTRLSLLSGGERSLTVLAFVFAIFRARPSPFYVLDEVDAALDDVNLQRLLKVVRSFRGHAQIIMVTHQKRTMEIADVLYGITMGPDGVTRVVSERLDAAEPVPAAVGAE